MAPTRTETDSLGPVEIASDRLWGAQTQRAIEHFTIGEERMPREILAAYAILKRAAAIANHVGGRLSEATARSIVAACDEILEGRHDDMFPLHVWMSGSGTQFNMNVNEVIANRVSQMAGQPLGSKKPAHPNDHVNMSQSTNDTFPTAMHVAAALAVSNKLAPALEALRDALAAKAEEWMDIVKIGRTHLQDATPLTLGQEFSGYSAMLTEGLARLDAALRETFSLALGGTAVGTGINAPADFAPTAIAEIARATTLPFVAAANRFAAQGAHDALVHLSGVLRGVAVSLYKIANDIRLIACGPRAGLAELRLPENEPGSSIMPGKVNPTQAEAMTMAAVQVMANDVAVGFAGAGGYLEMNVYKPLIAHNVLQSIRLLASASQNFRKHMIEGAEPDRRRIAAHVERSLMLATALAPRIGYDQAARAAHYAADHDLSVKEAALALRLAPEDELDRLLDPAGMVRPQTGSPPMKEPKAPEKGQPKPDDELDEALEETFPASDPLPASPGATGAEPEPSRSGEASGKKKR